MTRRTMLTIAVIVVVTFISLPAHEWAFENRSVRFVALGLGLVGLALWPCMVLLKYNVLVNEQAKNPQDRSPVRKMKLVAEICAGFALISFLSMFFRWGEQLDKENESTPYALLTEAGGLLYPIMGPEYCNAKPYRKIACHTLQTQLAQVGAAISSANQKLIGEEVRSIEFTLTSADIDGLSSKQKNDVKAALRKLRDIAIDNGFLAFVFAALPLYAFIFALSAVSSKTAVALFEYYDGRAQRMTFQRCGQSAAAWIAAKRDALKHYIESRQRARKQSPHSDSDGRARTKDAIEVVNTTSSVDGAGSKESDQ